MNTLLFCFLLLLFVPTLYGNVDEIEATNYKCDVCNLIIREAFYQQTLAKEEDFQLQTKGFHSTEEKQIGFEQVEAVKSEMYLEDLMSFVCGKTYFYALVKDVNSTNDLYRYLPKEFIGDRYHFVRNSTIQFLNDCFEMIDDFRDELIAFFKKDHIFPVLEWCHLTKGFCSKNETFDFKAYTVKKDETNPDGKEELYEVRLTEDGERKDSKRSENDNVKKKVTVKEATANGEL